MKTTETPEEIAEMLSDRRHREALRLIIETGGAYRPHHSTTGVLERAGLVMRGRSADGARQVPKATDLGRAVNDALARKAGVK